MLFWFVATAIWSVWFVFRDPKFDYRLVAIAALVPDLIDGLRGSVGPLHSVVTSIAVLFAIMVATAGRKPSRQRLLAVPIGMFIHLIFDGAFSNPETFWWPFMGANLSDEPLPSVERGLLNLPLSTCSQMVALKLASAQAGWQLIMFSQACSTTSLVCASTDFLKD